MIGNKIEDTYSEAFEGIFCRLMVTADDEETLRMAAEDATATPSIVIGRVEGGIEKWLNEKETLDKRKGVILQFWGGINPKAPPSDSIKNLRLNFPSEFAKIFLSNLLLRYLMLCQMQREKLI